MKAWLVFLSLILLGCQEDPAPGDEAQATLPAPDEVRLTFTDQGNAADVRTYTWQDDGLAGIFTPAEIVLDAGKTWQFEFLLFKEGLLLNSQYVSRATEARLFLLFDCEAGTDFNCANIDKIVPSYLDYDANGRYIGLEGELFIEEEVPTQISPRHGELDHIFRIVLRHQPEPNGKSATPIPDGSVLVGTTLVDLGYPAQVTIPELP